MARAKGSFDAGFGLRIQARTRLVVFVSLLSFSPLAHVYGVQESALDANIRLIQESFLYQKSLYRNMSFTAYYIQNNHEIEESQTKSSDLSHDLGKHTITRQDYQLNKNGKFLFEKQDYRTDTNYDSIDSSLLGQLESLGGPVRISFDNELYNLESRPPTGEPGLGSIFTPEQPYDFTRAMIKPVFFMDHIFNEGMVLAIGNNKNIKLTVLSDELWKLEYKDPDSDNFYDLELDLTQDFMITKMKGHWNVGKSFEKKMEYGKTEEGFYYLKKGTMSINGEEPTEMIVEEFRLNGPEENYTLEFQVGTRVTSHVNGYPEIYYAGQPGATADEKGDPSIYAVADKFKRIGFYNPDLSNLELVNMDAQVENDIASEIVSSDSHDFSPPLGSVSPIETRKGDGWMARYGTLSLAFTLIITGAFFTLKRSGRSDVRRSSL